MARVTSKLQVTIPKAIAMRHSIEPGDEITWMDAGDAIRLMPVELRSPGQSPAADRLKWFDDATNRQRLRESIAPTMVASAQANRGWTREELYSRGGPG
ncbi:MAG TPA: AbrB/MazE/SpoVT family DNA-binding domain-containing protein [Pirellulaceae bacterium]|jgi:bifunctional DNA-binding transcriptional regulator/antitoxin component of YhaV-PrlF toxin-antitoxin module